MALDLTDNPATDGAKAVLGKKYGPLPLWVWLIIIGGTVYGVKKFQSSRPAEVLADAEDAATVGSTSVSTGGLVTPKANATGSIYGGGTGAMAGANIGSYGPNRPDTNEAWMSRALSTLAANGKYDPYAIQMALSTFLSGFSVTDPTQRAIVSDALAAVGSPPSPFKDNNGGGGTPQGGDPELVRFIRPGDSPAIYAEYSDGSVRWIQHPKEMDAIVKSNPAAYLNNDGTWRVTVLPQEDSIFQRATLGVSQAEFDAQVAQIVKDRTDLFSGRYHNR